MIALVILFAGLLINACSTAPASLTKPKSYLIRNEHVYDDNAQFQLAYALGDGTSQANQGMLFPNEDDNGYVMIQSGSYSFITPEGTSMKMVFKADKDGFKVTGYPLPGFA